MLVIKAKSISIPSIGAGNLGYPADVVAKCLLEETASFLSRNKSKTSLQLVHFIIFDGTVHQAFQAKYARISSGKDGFAISPGGDIAEVSSQPQSRLSTVKDSSCSSLITAKNKSSSDKAPSSTVSTSWNLADDDTCSFSLPNDVLLHVVRGDITNEQVDVIVNTTNAELQLTRGGVAGALLKKGGPELQKACDSLRQQGFKAAEGKVVETRCKGMGELKCKSIFHIVFEGKDQRKLANAIVACLDRAEKLKYTSLALPAIGTGNKDYSPSLAAESIVKALKKFIQTRRPNYVRQIRIFVPRMFQQFCEAFIKIRKNDDGMLNYIFDKGSQFLQSAFNLFLNPEGGDEFSDEESHMEWSSVSDPHGHDYDKDEAADDLPLADIPLDAEVTLCIYGESDSAVQNAEKSLNDLIDTVFINEDVVDESILELPDSAKDTLKSFAKKHSVDIDIDTDAHIHTIKINGCQSDVLKVKDKVRDVLMEFHVYKTNKGAAATIQKHVKWVRQYSNDHQEDCHPVISYKIEQAFQQKEGSFKYTDGSVCLKIDFSSMEEIDLESGCRVKMQRVDFSEGILLAACMFRI